MQVAHVAKDVEAGDLPAAVGHLVEPSGKAIGDQARVVDRLAGRDDVGIGADLMGVAGEAEDRLLLVSGERGTNEQALDKARQRGLI